jgi:hypothetical protein
MAAYTDCSIQLLANTDPFFCDCSKIKNFSQLPSKEDTIKVLVSLQSDWNFLNTPMAKLDSPVLIDCQYNCAFNHCFIPEAPTHSLFRPPIV